MMYVSASVCICVCSMFARNFSVNHKKCKPKMKKFILNNLKMRERYRVHLFLPKLIYANRILPVVIHKTRHFIAFTCVIACHSHKISINISPSGRCECVCSNPEVFENTWSCVPKKTHKTFIVYCTRQHFRHLEQPKFHKCTLPNRFSDLLHKLASIYWHLSLDRHSHELIMGFIQHRSFQIE